MQWIARVTGEGVRRRLSRYFASANDARVLDERLKRLERCVFVELNHEGLELLEQLTFSNPCAQKLARIGSEGDGGYVVPVESLANRRVVSLGVGTDWSADRDCARLGAQVAMFDPTVEAPKRLPPSIRFFQLGVGTTDAGAFLTLQSILERLGWQGRNDLWLMMDVEGAEWEVLNSADLMCFEVVVLEMHQLDRLVFDLHKSAQTSGVNRLLETHIPVASHVNNLAATYATSAGPIPACLEVCLIRRDKFEPGPHDGSLIWSRYPNDPMSHAAI